MSANHKRQARRIKSGGRKTSPKIQDIESGSRARPGPRSKLNVYLSHHLWVALSTLGTLWRTPVSTVLTSSVIAIALALPTGLYVLLQNVQQLSSSWENSAQISVFMKSTVKPKQVQQLQQQLRNWQEIKEVRYISPEQALTEFRSSSGFGDALDILDANPLPAVLLIQPAVQLTDTHVIEALHQKLDNLPQVDQSILDMQWVQRLSAIIDAGKRGVFILGALLLIAILLVIGNTIRLTIFNKRQEIVVTKLIGATNQFIRRPFLYTGFWYGLFGALLAWLLVVVLMGLLRGPIDELAILYDSQFTLDGIDGMSTLILLKIGVILGLSGSWLAVGRHLKTIEPK